MGRGEELTRIHLGLPGQASGYEDARGCFMPEGFGSLASSAVLLGNLGLLEGGAWRR